MTGFFLHDFFGIITFIRYYYSASACFYCDKLHAEMIEKSQVKDLSFCIHIQHIPFMCHRYTV